MTAVEKRERRFNIYFRTAKEKQDAVEWANSQGHSSLNAYFLYLHRQDVKVNGGGRLASLEQVKQLALENRVRTAIEDPSHDLS